jgi:hypothetical protein
MDGIRQDQQYRGIKRMKSKDQSMQDQEDRREYSCTGPRGEIGLLRITWQDEEDRWD